jgi:hypothetical protein
MKKQPENENQYSVRTRKTKTQKNREIRKRSRRRSGKPEKGGKIYTIISECIVIKITTCC